MAARRAALTLLHGVTVLGRALDPMLDRALAGLSPSDRGLARALVSGVLRNLPGLDALIDSACRQPLPADARARQVLRIALAGRLLLDTPPHAAIATALPLLEGGPRRLTHGVLSTLFRTEATLPEPSVPRAWADRWREAWGEAEVEAAGRRLGTIPPTDLCLKNPADTGQWMERLGATSLMPGHIRLNGSQSVDTLAGYADGDWWVQDIAASLPARLLGDVAGMAVLDLCAAPGGKTMQLASMGARVTALDINASRLKRLRTNLQRTALQADVVEADARQFDPGRQFDAILLDAPCSATGTFGRHPDLLYLKERLDLAPLLKLQAELCARAAGWLKPGGRLVYAVCSLEPAEGEGASPPAGLLSDPVSDHELPEGLASSSGGTVRTLPSLWGEAGGADGFFIARYRAP
ncbi:RsmB/NOP family class I SAM-dependent RNA methyltransferase [Sandaracinobacteroides hominis]|uniref:RsmB/NOP family class I SAM-dependent RNA methyltransferase n=1 Tax=Sandaracinobacteroides hominis TaxID=2780086 RepID=UPI001F44AE4C|nr:transcription antitermination factor NusB [Sandaracinobacteroides hominis]